MKRLLLLLTLTTLLLTGCKEAESMMGIIKLTYTNGDPITGTIIVNANGATITLNLTSLIPCIVQKVGELPAWMTVTPENRASDATVTITVSPNPKTEYREHVLTFLAGNGDKAVITIEQLGMGYHAVTFSGNGTGVTNVPATQAIAEGAKVTVPVTTPDRTGYTFGGWYKESSCTTAWDFGTDVVTAATTLYARWTVKTYTVTFDLAGGVGNSTTNPQTIQHGDKVPQPADPTHTGYKFDGWYADKEYTTTWDFNNPITSDTQIWAKWVAVLQVTVSQITGQSAFGTVSIVGQSGSTTATLPTNTSVTVSATPNTNYVFVKWVATNDKNAVSVSTSADYTFTLTATTTLYAVFAATTQTKEGVKLLYLKGGTFNMGQAGIAIPVHEVTLDGFYLSETAITNAQYCAFLNAQGIGSDGEMYIAGVGNQQIIESHYSGVKYNTSEWVPQPGYDNHPVIMVSWYGADEYCKWAGGRLPTEAEWEYACRAGTTTPWNTGDELLSTQANFGINVGHTVTVKSYASNAWGLYEMHGNVWEWCNDRYGGYTADAVSNPQGPDSDDRRVLRGGDWFYVASYCRSAYRDMHVPCSATGGIGFRMACSL